jgi:glucose-1-phosphatase
MPAPRAFLFDIGNVILTFDFSRAVQGLARHSSVEPEVIRTTLDGLVPPMEDARLTPAEFIAQLREKIAFSGSETELVQAYVDIFTPNLPIWQLIEQLAPHYPLYHLSNTSGLHLDYIEQTYPIFSHFAGGAYSFACRSAKPHQPIYDHAAALCACAPDEIIYLDDLPPNVAAGQRQGWRTWTYDPADHAACLAWLRAQGLAVSV